MITPAGPHDDASLDTDASTGATVSSSDAVPARTMALALTLPTHAPAASGAPSWSAGDVLARGIVVERHLGRGGMGDVYLAVQPSTDERFAVKRARVATDALRAALFEEVRSWIDLPAHPHVVACRFVRLVGHELAVFAEYVGGGSLEDWIADGRVDELGLALRLAMELAFGLDAAHGSGLVHQDVKPANAFIGTDGTLKVGDFGLARFRTRRAAGAEATVPVEAMTPAFCSPEQANGADVGIGTDVWSWGLTVLQMFTRDLAWSFGMEAPDALARVRAGLAPTHVPLPAAVAEILERCFAPHPSDRWRSLADAADALGAVHASSCAAPHPHAPEWRARPPTGAKTLAYGAGWRPGSHWLADALRLAGSDPREAAHVGAGDAARSPIARAMGDLALLDRASAILEARARDGDAMAARTLGFLAHEHSLVLRFVGDLDGALVRAHRARETLERAAIDDVSRAFAIDVARAIDACASLELAVGRRDEARLLHDAALERLERLRDGGATGHDDVAIDLASCLAGRARVSLEAGRAGEALRDAEGAIAALAGAEPEPEQPARAHELALHVRMVRSAALLALGDHDGVIAVTEEALALADEVLAASPPAVAVLRRNRASALESLGRGREALADREADVATLGRIVLVEGRDDLGPDLAGAQMGLAAALLREGRRDEALAHAREAAERLDAKVRLAGRADLDGVLADLHVQHAFVRLGAGDAVRAQVLGALAVALRREQVERDGRLELRVELAIALQHLGNIRVLAGAAQAAMEPLEEALALLAPFGAEGAAEQPRTLATRARARDDVAAARARLGDLAGALADVTQAASLYAALVARGDAADHARALAWSSLKRCALLVATGDASRADGELGALLEAWADGPVPGLAEDVRAGVRAQALRQRREVELARGDVVAAVASSRALVAVLAPGADRSGGVAPWVEACLALAQLCGATGAHMDAFAVTDEVVERLAPLAAESGDRVADLACARVLRAASGFNLGRLDAARADARQGMAGLSTELARTGRADLEQMLRWAMTVFHGHLDDVS